MKKIALIRPFFEEHIKHSWYPLGLGYLASSLRKANFYVRIFDLNILHNSNEQFIEHIRSMNYDFFGITTMTFYFKSVIELCQNFKRDNLLREKPLIIGGVHASSIPDLSLRQTGADYVVIGEGEITIVELLNALVNKLKVAEVNGVGFLKDGKYIQTPIRDLIKKLDDLPFPAWDIIHPELYPLQPHMFYYKKEPIFPIITSRGCFHSCIYCASRNFWGEKLRQRSIQNVMDEIDYMERTYKVKEFEIWDDNFTINPKYVEQFCKEIYHRKFKLYFSLTNGVRIEGLSERLLRIMKNVGFWFLPFAIESGSPRLLKFLQKNLDLSTITKTVALAKKLGYFTRAFFMYGSPTESIKEIYKSLDLAISLKIDQANFFIFSPLPGSSFFKEWIKNKDLNQINWNYFDLYMTRQDMSGFSSISPKQIFKLQRYLHLRFNLLRPWILIKNMLRWKTKNYFIQLDRAKYFLKHLIR